jgi:hypothetical protein
MMNHAKYDAERAKKVYLNGHFVAPRTENDDDGKKLCTKKCKSFSCGQCLVMLNN